MNKADCGKYQDAAMAGIPENFAGRLLEVPVGTGILTMPLYQTLPDADVTCLDYSPDMMAQAREKAERMGLENVTFRQGDVGALPFDDASFDAVLSLNGFHAFPDKEAAYREVRRVLRRDDVFMICNECGGDGCGENWEKVVSGMTIYSGEQLRDMLVRAGFSGIRLHTNSRGWLCATAKNE